MATFDRDCEWYCDNCDAHLNNQSGFSAHTGSWMTRKAAQGLPKKLPEGPWLLG